MTKQPDAAQRAVDDFAASDGVKIGWRRRDLLCSIIRREQAKDLREVRDAYIELLTIAECDANTPENAAVIARAQKALALLPEESGHAQPHSFTVTLNSELIEEMLQSRHPQTGGVVMRISIPPTDDESTDKEKA